MSPLAAGCVGQAGQGRRKRGVLAETGMRVQRVSSGFGTRATEDAAPAPSENLPPRGAKTDTAEPTRRAVVTCKMQVTMEDAMEILDALQTAVAAADVERALARVPEECRAVLVLHDLQGFRYEEIATIVDAPLGTVKSRLSRARAALRLHLQAALPELGDRR